MGEEQEKIPYLVIQLILAIENLVNRKIICALYSQVLVNLSSNYHITYNIAGIMKLIFSRLAFYDILHLLSYDIFKITTEIFVTPISLVCWVKLSKKLTQ